MTLSSAMSIVFSAKNIQHFHYIPLKIEVNTYASFGAIKGGPWGDRHANQPAHAKSNKDLYLKRLLLGAFIRYTIRVSDAKS
jgi:hypothetical protein